MERIEELDREKMSLRLKIANLNGKISELLTDNDSLNESLFVLRQDCDKRNLAVVATPVVVVPVPIPISIPVPHPIFICERKPKVVHVITKYEPVTALGRPSVLVSKSPDEDTYAYMNNEWLPVLSSGRMLKTGKFLGWESYDYNKKGQIRKHLPDGNTVVFLFSIKTRFFYIDGLTLFMTNPEICVGNGMESCRFDTHAQATASMGFNTKEAESNFLEVDGWRVECGWPMPYSPGFPIPKDGDRLMRPVIQD